MGGSRRKVSVKYQVGGSMGGSRRKSRKSMLNRRRQQQHQHQQQTNEIDTYAYGTEASGKHEKEICPSGEDLEVNASKEKYDISRDPQTIPSKMVAPPNSVEYIKASLGKVGMETLVHAPKQAVRGLEFYEGAMNVVDSFGNAKKKFSTSRDYEQHDGHSSKFGSHYGGKRMFNDIENSRRDRGDGRSSFLEESYNKREHELSLKNWPTEVNRKSADSLMDGGYRMSDFSFEEPFSPKRFASSTRDKYNISGLGNVGMETPVHSPKQVGRTFSYGCSSPLHGAKKVISFKNQNRRDDIEIKMEDPVMRNVKMPPSSSGLKLSEHVMDVVDSSGNGKKKCSTFRDHKQHDGDNMPQRFRDPSSAFDSPELHVDARSFKQCEPVANSSFISEVFTLHDSPMTSKFGIGTTMPEIFPYNDGQTPSPKESFSKHQDATSQNSTTAGLVDGNCILKGTTAYARIYPTTIELASDKRQCWVVDQQLGIIFVSTDDHSKIRRIGRSIAVAAAGVSHICEQFISFADAVYNAGFGNAPAREGPYLVAKTLRECIENWHRTNTGGELPPDFLVIGYSDGHPLLLTVRSGIDDQISLESRIGYGASIGSGMTYASKFAEEYGNRLLPGALEEAAIVAASIQDKSTGGKVDRVTLAIGGEVTDSGPSLSILKHIVRDYGLYVSLLQNSLFFCFAGTPYAAEIESFLTETLLQTFPATILRTHVISRRRTDVFRIMTLDDGYQSFEVSQLVRDGLNMEILPGLLVEVVFYEPRLEELTVLEAVEDD